MKQWNLDVSFATPAFIGDAEQNGAWRTPPFKGLLRQWWRVAAASSCDYDVNRLRERELALFGSASGETGGKSKVRLRLEKWDKGSLKSWIMDPKVFHKEVGKGGRKVGAHLYLGFGPLTHGDTGRRRQDGTPIKDTVFAFTKTEPKNQRSAIDAGEENGHSLRVAAPESITDALQLAAWFGTVGSRSRNGWGSLLMKGEDIESIGKVLDGTEHLLSAFCRPLEDCLMLDWPHAIGCDDRDGALVWKSRQGFGRWEDAMKHLAEVKIAFRTAIAIASNRDIGHPSFEDRHILAYPVTNHGVDGWVEKRNGAYKTDKRGKLVQSERLANQIRFKVVRSGGRLHALVFHLPCDIPRELKLKLGNQAPSHAQQLRVWRAVHDVLDERMQRLGGLA